jgi:predicted dehydrogenase
MRSCEGALQRLRLGFVGGSVDSGIGATHRYAAQLDGHYELVAGCFSSDAERNAASGRAYGIAPDRIYPSFERMAEAEASRSDRIDVVTVMTPNALHVPASLAFLARGIDVICDKPLATSVEEALALEHAVRESGRVFVLTHNYSAFPMIREARARIAAGAIGDIRLIQVEQAGAFGVDPLEDRGLKRLAWRTTLDVAGPSAVLADVGVHAHHLVRFVTGIAPTSVCADLSTLSPGRRSDDNAHVMLRFQNGVRGLMWASFVAAGHRQGLQLRVFGSTGSLLWHQEDPDRLVIKPQHAPHFIVRRGEPWVCEEAEASTRVKAGQVEGQIEAFANLYAEAAELVRRRRAGEEPSRTARLCPTVTDGVAGMYFMEACVRSHSRGGVWVDVDGAAASAFDPSGPRGSQSGVATLMEGGGHELHDRSS